MAVKRKYSGCMGPTNHSRRRRAVGAVVAVSFLLAFLFGTLHIVAHHSPTDEAHCYFCKYFDFSQIKSSPHLVIECHMVVVELCLPPPLSYEGISPFSLDSTRSPPTV